MKNQVIEVLTREHGEHVIQYWKDKGINTRQYRGRNTKAAGNSARYYGVINGRFGSYKSSKVKAEGAEIIELPTRKGYVFDVTTTELSKAVQLRLVDLGYGHCNVLDNKVVDFCGLKYIFAENDGCTMWADNLPKKAKKEYIKGDLNTLFYTDAYKYTPPKIIMELTMEEIAEKLGVDEVIIKS